MKITKSGKMSDEFSEALTKVAAKSSRNTQSGPIDLSNLSDRDLGPAYTPEEEESALLGEEEPDDNYAYKSGYSEGLRGLTESNPYRVDTESGRSKFIEWRKGYADGQKNRSKPH